MVDASMIARVTSAPGFFAALDQSGGSTPGALRLYGISEGDYSSPDEMFRLMHEMRVRIITAPSFTGKTVVGTILFEQTMDGDAAGRPVPSFLWRERGVVPFVKVDKGLAAERNGVRLMNDMPDLDVLLGRAVRLGVAGTKMRATVRLPDRVGIAAIVRQQFEFGERIAKYGLLPILEPEVLINSPDKAGAELILRDEIAKALDALPDGRQVVLKITIPEQPNVYLPFMDHPRVARVIALSGGYNRHDACEKLQRNHGLIASFSRALLEDLRHGMSATAFDAALGTAIDEIYAASVDK